jgi:hypothetical protein
LLTQKVVNVHESGRAKPASEVDARTSPGTSVHQEEEQRLEKEEEEVGEAHSEIWTVRGIFEIANRRHV